MDKDKIKEAINCFQGRIDDLKNILQEFSGQDDVIKRALYCNEMFTISLMALKKQL